MKGARHLSAEEISEIAKCFYGKYAVRNRAMFLLALNVGSRISELLGLNVGDCWQYGKPVEVLELRKAITKGKRTRQVPLNDHAREVIAELMTWKQGQGEDLSPSAALFVSRKGGRVSRFQGHRILKDCFGAAECSGRVSTHSLRKSFARRLLDVGCNLKVLQELLGHHSLNVTQRYLEVSPEELSAAVHSLTFAA